jgi:hypothetical protein
MALTFDQRLPVSRTRTAIIQSKALHCLAVAPTWIHSVNCHWSVSSRCRLVCR